jgi:23S rRNA pseudouridine1911/1915/1917 synthase
MEPGPLVILFEDAHCLALAKPGGLAVQGRVPGEPSVEAAVRKYLRPDDPGAVYVGIVHRLDKPASGTLLWAKTPKAARRLAEQFAGRRAHKQYWAVVAGTPKVERGLWEDWLSADPATGLGRVQICKPEAPRSRHARSRFEVGRAERLPEGCSWLKLWPETGRTHQLRVQAAARGTPILGDRLYGSERGFTGAIALHARSLVVEHPVLRTEIEIVAPVPDSWQEQGIVVGKR